MDKIFVDLPWTWLFGTIWNGKVQSEGCDNRLTLEKGDYDQYLYHIRLFPFSKVIIFFRIFIFIFIKGRRRRNAAIRFVLLSFFLFLFFSRFPPPPPPLIKKKIRKAKPNLTKQNKKDEIPYRHLFPALAGSLLQRREKRNLRNAISKEVLPSFLLHLWRPSLLLHALPIRLRIRHQRLDGRWARKFYPNYLRLWLQAGFGVLPFELYRPVWR